MYLEFTGYYTFWKERNLNDIENMNHFFLLSSFLWSVANNPFYSACHVEEKLIILHYPAANCRNWNIDTARTITDTAFNCFRIFSTHSTFSTSKLCKNLDDHSESQEQPFPALSQPRPVGASLWTSGIWGSLFRYGKWFKERAFLKSQGSARPPRLTQRQGACHLRAAQRFLLGGISFFSLMSIFIIIIIIIVIEQPKLMAALWIFDILY